MARKKWTPQEDAWLYVNLGEGNIALSELLNRSIPSIESRKRQIRNSKVIINKTMVKVLNSKTIPLKYWLNDPDLYTNQPLINEQAADVLDLGAQGEFKIIQPAPEERDMIHKAIEESIEEFNKEILEPEFIPQKQLTKEEFYKEMNEALTERIAQHTIYQTPVAPPPVVDVDQDKSISCLEGREKDLGVDNGSAGVKGITLFTIGAIVILAILTLILIYGF
jgi:hypothetical protein